MLKRLKPPHALRQLNMANHSARALIAKRIRSMTGSTKPPTMFLEPAGDSGLFGPTSVTWLVHAHFVSMLVGGLSSLLIQALHPGALAGVWDHSSFRTNLKARLGRTAYFIAATTYGGTEMALQAIAQVNKVHKHITGIRPDGKPYSACDPHLLKWVHLGETISFLNAYCTHGDKLLSQSARDQYFFEMIRVSERLGATHLPNYQSAALNMLKAYETELKFDDRTREIVHVIDNFPADLQDRVFVKLIIQAAYHALPDWVLVMLQRAPAPEWQKKLTYRSLALLSSPIDWALQTEGVAAHARRRMHAL
jgi:uncharacterized protein (DUF2236 family)